MILRKPYAFLIRYFKLFHLILMGCMLFLMYRTSQMISFLNEYIDAAIPPRGKDFVAGLYDIWVFLLPIFIILFSLIILLVLAFKKKPIIFYIVCIIAHVAILGVYIYGYGQISNMTTTILDVRSVRLLRDLYLYCILFQGVFSIITFIRGLGFDLKKFEFGADLEGLEIDSSDNEEIELDFDFDISDKKRQGKRILRMLKYKYKENKFIVRIAAGVLVAIGIFWAYSSYNIYNRTSPERTNFNMNGFTLGVHKSYIINTNASGEMLGENDRYVVVVDLLVRNNGKTPTELNTGAIELNIAGDKYHHTSIYDGHIGDLGIVYKNQKIGNEFTHYLLAFEVPLNTINSRMNLEFRNLSTSQTAKVRLNKVNLVNQKNKTNEYKLGDEVKFSDTALGDTTLKISSYELRNRFVINYRYCSPRGLQCISSIEYLQPTLYNSNKSKTLLKLEAELNFDEAFTSKDVKDVYGLVKTFGYIEYTYEGEVRRQDIYLGNVKSNRVKQEGVYYIEVYEEIRVAEKVAIVFQIRHITYKYQLK